MRRWAMVSRVVESSDSANVGRPGSGNVARSGRSSSPCGLDAAAALVEIPHVDDGSTLPRSLASTLTGGGVNDERSLCLRNFVASNALVVHYRLGPLVSASEATAVLSPMRSRRNR